MDKIHVHSLADHVLGKRDFSILPAFPKSVESYWRK